MDDLISRQASFENHGEIKSYAKDTIYRQDAIDLLKQMRKDGDMVPWEGKDVFARIRKLPSVQPERKKGRWIDIDAETYTWKIRCDQCGHERSMLSTGQTYPRFCENCGAEMRGDGNG